MAIRITSVLLFNIYAPTNELERDRLFRDLAALQLDHKGPIFMGGDFNCCLHPRLDRSNQATAASHYSTAPDARSTSGGFLP